MTKTSARLKATLSQGVSRFRIGVPPLRTFLPFRFGSKEEPVILGFGSVMFRDLSYLTDRSVWIFGFQILHIR